MKENTSRFITTGEAASHCQVSIPALRAWIRDGRLRAFQTPGGHARIELGEFQRFLKEFGMPEYHASGAGESSSPRVLVVEDDPEILKLLVRVLASYPRVLTVETAADGYEALIKVGTFRPSLLILDVVMPNLDGLAVCHRLRVAPETRDIKILAITGHSDMVESVLEAGADACVTKPFNFRSMEQELDRLLALAERV